MTIFESFDLSTQPEMSFSVSFLTTLIDLMRGCRVTTSPFNVIAVLEINKNSIKETELARMKAQMQVQSKIAEVEALRLQIEMGELKQKQITPTCTCSVS